MGKLVGACVFPAGLTLVILAGSELFTGNCLIIISVLEKEATVAGMLRNWVIVYLAFETDIHIFRNAETGFTGNRSLHLL